MIWQGQHWSQHLRMPGLHTPCTPRSWPQASLTQPSLTQRPLPLLQPSTPRWGTNRCVSSSSSIVFLVNYPLVYVQLWQYRETLNLCGHTDWMLAHSYASAGLPVNAWFVFKCAGDFTLFNLSLTATNTLIPEGQIKDRLRLQWCIIKLDNMVHSQVSQHSTKACWSPPDIKIQVAVGGTTCARSWY